MPIPLIVIFSCGVGVPPAQKFDEKDFCKRSIEVYAVVFESEAQRFFEEASASLQQRLDCCFDQLKLNIASKGIQSYAIPNSN